MKQSAIFKILLVFLISLILLSGCIKAEEAIAYDYEPLPEQISKSKSSINVIVDPRIELLSIVHYLSDYRELESYLMTSFDFDYTDRVREHFEDFKDHEAVKFIYKLAMQGLSFDAPPGLMLHMGNDFTIREDAPLTDYLVIRASGQKNIDKLFNLLGEFALETDFNDFFNSNQEYYKSIIDDTLSLIDEERNIVSGLEDYYGMSKNSYNVILASLHGPVGYGPQVGTDEGQDNYSIIGTQGSKFMDEAKFPSFGTESDFVYLQEHEFSHSFINPITEDNLDLINSYDHLFQPIKEKMENQAYNNWENALNEHIIRALTSRFAYLTDKDKGLTLLSLEMRNGFMYTNDLFYKLEDYENNRDIYPTFEDFYPELLSVLD